MSTPFRALTNCWGEEFERFHPTACGDTREYRVLAVSVKCKHQRQSSGN